MTTVVAVKKGKKVCIASDSLSVFGTRKELFGADVTGVSKIIKLGPNFIGLSGHPSWALVLADYFSKEKKLPSLNTSAEVFEFFNRFHKVLKKQYHLNPPDLKFLPFESSELNLLLINASGIFEVEHSRMVRHCTNYSAIGTGDEYALGAMHAVYDKIQTAEETARIGITAAAQFDRKSSLPIQIYTL